MAFYKYYNAIVFETTDAAIDFSRQYHVLPEGENPELNTRYRFPVCVTFTGETCVVVFDLNQLNETDISRVTIEKVADELMLLY